ncbi:unnamed protein product [Blepharisma stoltei]|uniref:UDENN domain-containing protein n=1 Tax=Blepharisma stoltei TaxID=1481888 RepID=A0AAU9JXT2_9CILI|nr:unnamed protein product [Blepharisma stoltei]
MENLFEEKHPPPIKLVDSIIVLGLSTKSLRNIFIEGKLEGTPEVLAKLPPSSKDSKVFSQDQINMIFTDRIITLESNPLPPAFFSTTITSEKGYFTHIHCLITYEKINPSIIESSKERRIPKNLLEFVPRNTEEENNHTENDISYYIPVALCLLTNSNYIDLFRNILEKVYVHTWEMVQQENLLLGSTEFLRNCFFLLNDTIIPPNDINYTIKVGNQTIPLPLENKSRFSYNESCVAVLMDLIDIRNIIEFWESLLLSKHAFIHSGNEYLLFLILEAFKIILFPMTWTMNYVPVLSSHLTDYMQTPTPILIGFNSKQISKEEAVAKDPEATILDVDSNILYSQSEPLLCNCVKAKLSKKLQLAKAYYYVNRGRLNTFRMNTLEKNIKDPLFVNTARKLLEPIESDEREQIFVSLVRHSFLEVFIEGIGNFSKYLKYSEETKLFDFQEDDFIKDVSLCSNCKMQEFWKGFIDSVTFQQFLFYYGMFDECTLNKFRKIVKEYKKGTYEIYATSSCYPFNVSSSISPKFMYEYLKKEVEELPTENHKQKFIKNTEKALLEKIMKKLQRNNEYYDQAELSQVYDRRKMSLSMIRSNLLNSSEEAKEITNIYYGKYGIAMLARIPLCLSRSKFREISSQRCLNEQLTNECELNPTRWEPFALKLFYSLRRNKKNWQLSDLLEICKIINRLNTQNLPRHHATLILSLNFEQNEGSVRILIRGQGELSNLARVYIQSLSHDRNDRNPRASIDEDMLSPGGSREISRELSRELSGELSPVSPISGNPEFKRRHTRVIKYHIEVKS